MLLFFDGEKKNIDEYFPLKKEVHGHSILWGPCTDSFYDSIVWMNSFYCFHRLEFSNGDREVEKFRMIERHYFRDQLVKSFDFKFGFVPPNTRNSWDVIYDVPLIDDGLVTQMLANPYETRSDSFYFVGGKLIMHNMAEYRYTENSIEAQGKANAENMPDPSASSGSSSGGGSGGSSKTSDSGAGQKRNRGGSKFDDDEEEEDNGAGTKFSYK